MAQKPDQLTPSFRCGNYITDLSNRVTTAKSPMLPLHWFFIGYWT